MESREESCKITVEGFIRQYYENQEEIPQEIETLIFIFYFIKLDSKILNDAQIDTLIKLLPNANTINEFNLILRASDDGHEGELFCDRTHQKSSCFTIAQSKDNWIFGGYSKCARDKTANIGTDSKTFIEDDSLESFIFVLESPSDEYKQDVPHKWFVEHGERALYNYYNGFGYGNDWWVSFSKECHGYLGFGNSYDIKPETLKRNDYSNRFQVQIVDYEVWQINS